MSSYTDKMFEKVLSHKGVEAIILSDAEGVPIRYNSVDEEK